MSERKIPVESNDDGPSKVKVTRLGKGVIAIAAMAALTPVAMSENNPVGWVSQEIINTGVDFVDAIPGVDLPDREQK